jgi:hypothetical protein
MYLLWGGCVVAGPVVMDALLDSHMVYSHRYFIAASGPLYLCVALALAGTARHLGWIVGGGFLVFLLVSTGLYLRGFTDALMREVAVREASEHIDQRSAGADDLILVLDPGFNPLDFAYYLRSNPDFARLRIPEWRPSKPDLASQLQTLTRVKERARIWYLDDGSPEMRARTAVVEWLRAHFVEVEAREFRHVGVYLFAPRDTAGVTGLTSRQSP